MKKIMFNDRYGLTQAVLTGRKTQTRRIITNCTLIRLSPFSKSGVEDNHGYELKPRFHVGEIVAIAQSYKDCTDECIRNTGLNVTVKPHLAKEAGYKNKMFVRADLMPHQIRFTNVRVERLQDISDEDCIAEGVCKWTKDEELFKYDLADGFELFEWRCKPRTPREAYAALIDHISGKGTWERNPYVFVYEFELVY